MYFSKVGLLLDAVYIGFTVSLIVYTLLYESGFGKLLLIVPSLPWAWLYLPLNSAILYFVYILLNVICLYIIGALTEKLFSLISVPVS